MQFGKIYSDAAKGLLKPTEEQEKTLLSTAELEMSLQTQHNWMMSPVTQNLVSGINKEILELEDNARKMACTYPEHNNHQKIIHALVRASELRKVLEHYAQ